MSGAHAWPVRRSAPSGTQTSTEHDVGDLRGGVAFELRDHADVYVLRECGRSVAEAA